MLTGIHFYRPEFFGLLAIIPLMVAWYIFTQKNQNADLQVSTVKSISNIRQTPRQKFRIVLFILRCLAVFFIIIALARPQSSSSKQDISIEGIDIVMALDISGSMLAEDFKPNRLAASKEVASEFIEGRPTDRIGLVIFSGECFTQCPLTTDHAILRNLFDQVESGMIEDGTAMGDGLATAVNRLRGSKAISKVVILLTDGINNKGSMDPLSAAEAAKLFGVRVYTIGVGKKGMAPYPFKTPFGTQYQNIEVQIDEPLLQQIAETTNGKYFRATDKQKLQEIYKEIDKLEKSKIDVTEFKRKTEEFFWFVLIAIILIISEITLKNTVFKSIP
jgi:Ca-activated chloride channel family protein